MSARRPGAWLDVAYHRRGLGPASVRAHPAWRGTGLGEQLQEIVLEAIAEARELPDAVPRVPGLTVSQGVRRRVVPKFPYALVYFVEAKVLNVVAVAHTSRRPGYWVERLP